MLPDLPFVSCLCPTYLRPRLLENAIACFEAQDYPANRRELIILDDAGQLQPQQGPSWEVVSISRRFRSLPEKFNAIAGMARGDVLVIWEDDDIYLPWHIRSHVSALCEAPFSKPSMVLSTYTGQPLTEGAAGRFHASMAFTRAVFDSIGGWPLTKRGDFDQQLISRLSANRTADTCLYGPISGPPSYCFRWGSTNAYHGQAAMRSADDEEWYDRTPQQFEPFPDPLQPRFDDETQAVIRQLG